MTFATAFLAAALAVPSMPPPEYDDCEVATNCVSDFIDGMSLDDFLADRKTRDAVIRNCEVIGEAIKHIPDEYRALHPEVDWSGLAGLRDVLMWDSEGVCPRRSARNITA